MFGVSAYLGGRGLQYTASESELAAVNRRFAATQAAKPL